MLSLYQTSSLGISWIIQKNIMRDGTIKSKLRRYKDMCGHNATGKVLLFKLFRRGSKV